MKFVSLHHHSTFSYMDGYGTPAQHVERAAELGMTALALTEHGNVSSHVGLEKAATKAGVKPIFGLEAYTHPEPDSKSKFHLTLLAADAVGYRNLNQIVSRSWAEGFYQYPTVSGQILADHSDGIICLSGCSDSLLACSLLGGKTIHPSNSSFKTAQRVATNFRALFGDRYYLECQIFPELERTQEINTKFARLSEITGIPLVATADVHTVRPGQSELRALLHAAGRGNNTIAQQLSSWEYEVPDYTPLSDKKVYRRLRGTGLSKIQAWGALHNTAEIADRCNVVLPKSGRFRYPTEDPEALLWEWLREGWKYRVAMGNRRLLGHTEDYTEQIKREMGLIVEKDFVSYFLLVADIIVWAKSMGIAVGPGRGSSAASVVCYLLRITEPDPLQFPLTDFSRFVDPTRIDLPDIDTDFEDGRRHEVREYAVRKFGADNVANIGTFTKYKGRNSITDVARVYRLPKTPMEAVKGMIIDRSGGDSRADASLADTFDTFPDAAAILQTYPQLKMAIALEGNYRGMSTHAAGLVISDRPITDVCATYTREAPDGELLSAVSVNKYDAEYLGLMKFDALGLSTMGTIAGILRRTGMRLDELYALPFDDKKTVRAFTESDVIGIFQFEGRATRLVCKEVRPDDMFQIVDVNALSRPGPLFSGTTSEYIDVKHGRRELPKIHPIIDSITAGTRGQIIYQEQILRSLAQFGGLSVGRVHEIRRIISQKLGEAQFNTSAEDFVTNAVSLNGVSRETARLVWERVVTSASYAFVYSHSLVYSIIGYWCQWFKQHYPTEFYIEQLGQIAKEAWPRLVVDAERHGVRVRGVMTGVSQVGWSSPKKRQIVAGYEQLKGVGPVTARKIVETEQVLRAATGAGFARAEDLLEVSGIGPATLAGFTGQVNAEDPFGIRETAQALNGVRAAIADGSMPLRPPSHNSNAILEAQAETPLVWVGRVKLKEFKDEIEDTRARTGQSVEEIRRSLKRPDLLMSCVLHCYDDGDEDVYIRMNRWGYPKFARAVAAIALNRDIVYVVGKKSRAFGASIWAQEVIVIEP